MKHLEDGTMYMHEGGLYIYFNKATELHFRVTPSGSCHKASDVWYKHSNAKMVGNVTPLFSALFKAVMSGGKT